MNSKMIAAQLRRVSGLAVALILTCAVTAGFGLAKRRALPAPPVAAHEVANRPSSRTAHGELAREYGALPLSFEANQGQTDPSVQFVSRGTGYTLFLTKNEAVIELQQQDSTSLALQKMKPRKRKLFESGKFYRGSPRSRKSRKTKTVQVAIADANPNPQIESLDELPGKTNYFIGNDPRKWQSGIPTFERVKYSGIYPGIDLVYYGKQRQLEFDFVVAPGADPKKIGLKIQTDGRLLLTKKGDVRLETGASSFELRHPDIYQLNGGKKRLVAGRFTLQGDRLIGFQVGSYDRRQPLIIDPALAYSTYLGGNGTDDGFGIAVDANGNAYVVGQTTSTNFPTLNGYSSSANANGVAFVSELNPTGTALIYSTYLGGTGGDAGNGIALDPSGNVYVTGYTMSSDFPVVNGFQTSTGTTDANAFVARIDTTQTGTASLVYSTYLGGGGNSTNPFGDVGYAIAADASGLAYITGQTTSDTSVAPFPTTTSAYQSSLGSQSGNAFLTVLDTTQTGASSLLYSTYLGGSSTGFGDYGLGVGVDAAGNAYVTGSAASGSPTAFPTTSNAYQTSLNSPYGNVFVTEIATTQSGAGSLVYSTYLGGSGDSSDESGDAGLSLALDSLDRVYVSGSSSSPDFPVTSGAYQTTNPSDSRAFVAKLDLTQSGAQSLIYSTYLGGSNGEEGFGIAVDTNGNAYVAGITMSSDFPTTAGAYEAALNSSFSDAFFTELNPTGTGLLYSTYLGGSCADGDAGNAVVLDSNGNPYVAGSTCSSDFPTYPSSTYQSSLGGTQNAFVTKFALVADPSISASVSPSPDSSGWNNSSVTVSFACLPGGAPISSCSSPATVSTEGANQVITGTATDTSSNTATTSATVNLDLTPPSLSITTPTNGASVSTPYVAVSGSVSDALSGVGGVSCNGAPASLSGSAFSCTVPLNLVSNSITVTGFDLAGNSATATVSVSVSMSAPTSLQITPGPATMQIGSNQSFTAIDQTGTRRPDATWSVSDTTIATLATDGSGALTGVAAGQVTLTATIGNISGNTQVTVLAGSSLTAGTVLWSAPAVSGFTAFQVIQAVPTVNGPDLYSIESDSSGDMLSRAFTADGKQLWQSSLSASLTGPFVGDNFGGLLAEGYNGSLPAIVDLNAQTGNQNWEYTVASVSGATPSIGGLTVGLDGTIYTVEQNCSYSEIEIGSDDQPGYSTTTTACLNAIGGGAGNQLSQVTLPNSTGESMVGQNCDIGAYIGVTSYPGAMGPSLIVAPDGFAYMEIETTQTSSDLECSNEGDTETSSYSESLLLLRNGASFKTLNSHGGSGGDTPGMVIPDGNGGILVTYVDSSASGLTIADTLGSQATFSNLGSASGMVLGDNNTAFVTDGLYVVAFDATSIQQLWTYTSTGGTLSFINATSGGGVAINDSELGAIQLSSTGSASTPVASLLGSVPFSVFSWQGIAAGELAMTLDPDGSNGITTVLPQSPSPSPNVNPQGQSAPPPCFTTAHHCVLVPVSDNYSHPSIGIGGGPERDLIYGLYFLDSSRNLNPQYQHIKPKFEIVNREAFATPPNTDTDATICTGNNYVSTCNGEDNHLTDGLSEGNASLTISVTQTFYVNRQQVQVYWPQLRSNQIQWYGSPRISDLGKNPAQPNQQATTVGRTVGLIYQLDLDPQLPASCVRAENDPSYGGGCSTTPSHP
jgi:Glucodextranase, domain B/Beta-propeller repeat/Bacterial Ig-like domain (group 2)